MTVTVQSLTGAALVAQLDALAALRIRVFRDWPYLYDGDHAYERRYLEIYRRSSTAIVVGAFADGQLVGAATGTALSDHAEDFAAALTGQPVPIESAFYCAESVLLPAFRGQGLGHAFFDAREAHARHLGFTHGVFAAVIRPDDHPLRPEMARSLEPFWRKRGYRPLADAIARFDWKDVDQPQETSHALQIWSRPLS